LKCPIWEAGDKGVLLATKSYKMHKKTFKKVLYKDINSSIPAYCMQGFGMRTRAGGERQNLFLAASTGCGFIE
jgi:hypothetical protein